MTKAEQMKSLLNCVTLFSATDIFGKPGASFWWKMVKYAHSHGFLYTSFDKDTLDTAMIMYRVKDMEATKSNDLPEKEDGNILYVLACASRSRDRMKLNKIRNYFTKTNPDIEKIVMNHRNSETDLRVFEVNRGKTQQA